LEHPWRDIMQSTLKGFSWLVIVAAILLCVVALQLGMIVLALFLAHIAYKVNRYKNKLWTDFATANGWTIDIMTSVTMLVPPSLTFGHSPQLSPIVQAKISDLTFDM